MAEYRITKYDPARRVDGVYMSEEWTSFSDIGKSLGGAVLTEALYQKTENAYIDCCIALLETAGIPWLCVEQAEYYEDHLFFSPKLSGPQEIRGAITACLREQCWMKLTARDFFIHFGYDCYMYIGTSLPGERVAQIAAAHGLYCEQYSSPYS